MQYSLRRIGNRPSPVQIQLSGEEVVNQVLIAIRPNALIDGLQDLHFSHFGSNCRTDLLNRFPLYRAFRFVRDYRLKIAAFTRIPLYLFSYETSSLFLRLASLPRT